MPREVTTYKSLDDGVREKLEECGGLFFSKENPVPEDVVENTQLFDRYIFMDKRIDTGIVLPEGCFRFQIPLDNSSAMYYCFMEDGERLCNVEYAKLEGDDYIMDVSLRGDDLTIINAVLLSSRMTKEQREILLSKKNSLTNE